MRLAHPLHHARLAWVAMAVLIAGGLVVAVWSLGDWREAPNRLLIFGLLTVLAVAAWAWPLYARPRQDRYVATPAFVFAGVLLLPGSLLTALVALSLVPTAVLHWRRSEPWVGYAVNTAVALIAAHAARLLVGPDRAAVLLATSADLVEVAAAGALFVGLQVLPAAVLTWLDGGRDSAIADTVNPVGLAVELAIAGFGASIALVWLRAPWGLVLTLAPTVALAGLLREAELVAGVIADERKGLLAYRHLEGVLNQEVERARRYRRPLALLVVGVDDASTVRDRNGYPAGDTVLEQLGQVVRDSLRSVDFQFRFGPDEFLLVLVETELAQALQTAERLRTAIGSHPFTADRPNLPVRLTVSLGAVALPEHGETLEALLHGADLALWQAQASGGNRVEIAPPRASQPVVGVVRPGKDATT